MSITLETSKRLSKIRWDSRSLIPIPKVYDPALCSVKKSPRLFYILHGYSQLKRMPAFHASATGRDVDVRASQRLLSRYLSQRLVRMRYIHTSL